MSMKITVDKKVWLNLKKEFVKAAANELQVGWFESDRYGSDNDNLQMAQVAQWQEEGVASKGIPPRPFMRVGFRDKLIGTNGKASFERIIKSVASGGDTFKAISLEGDNFTKMLQDAMYSWNAPMNAPLTIELKGFNDPLIETAQLVEGASSKVAKKGT